MTMGKGSAIVTGGAGGIGQALLSRLHADGFHAVSWDLRTDVPAADQAIAVDVTNEAALHAALAATQGSVNVLVINAGVLGPVAPVWETDAKDFRRVLEINLTAAFLCAKVVVPAMLKNPGPDRGRIVMIASVQGKEGTALGGAYAASKAGMIGLVKVLGKELALDGVLVNAITPTVVRTPMLDEITAERSDDLKRRIPMGRFLDAGEVAAMASWLCGPDCSFSTGAVFDLSGGRATY
jgi:2-dehydro-3-deoxy-L-rhamnonate dehydrogenase (NAD+)